MTRSVFAIAIALFAICPVSAVRADDLARRFPELMNGVSPPSSTSTVGRLTAQTPTFATTPTQLAPARLIAPVAISATETTKPTDLVMSSTHADLIGGAVLTPAATGRFDDVLRSQLASTTETSSVIRALAVPPSASSGMGLLDQNAKPFGFVRGNAPAEFSFR